MTRGRWALFVARGVPLAAAAFPPLPKPKEKKATAKDIEKALQGSWEVTRIERGGAKGAAKLPATATMTLTIKGTDLTRSLWMKDRELKAAPGTIKLDASKSPAWFDVPWGKGRVSTVANMKGRVRVDGDTMTWPYTLGGENRPTKIDGALAARQYRYTLKRVKP